MCRNTLLRLPEDEENRISALKKEIAAGIKSGIAKDFKPKKYLALLKSVKRKNGWNLS